MKRCIAVCFVLICNLLNAQVQFEARVSKTTLGLNERLRIDFMMNVDGDNFKPEGGDMLSPPATRFYKIVVDFKTGKFTVTPQ